MTAAQCASLFDRLQNVSDRFAAGPRTKVSFTVDADADRVGVHIPFSDHEHGVHFHLLRALDFAVDFIGAYVDFGAHLMSAQFVENRSRVIE